MQTINLKPTMKIFQKIIFLAILSLVSVSTFAQDTIKKKNGEVLKVVVKEIDDTQIKYHHFDDPNEVLFTVDRMMVDEIKFAYGVKYKEEEPLLTDDYFEDDADIAIKLGITGFLFESAMLSIDKAVSPTKGVQVTAKLIGIGFGPSADDLVDRSGFGLELGYRLKFGGLKKKKYEYRPSHILSGGYVMPIIGFNHQKSSYNYNWNNDDYSESHSNVYIGLLFGKQSVVQNVLVIDYYGGFSLFGGKSTYKNNGIDRPSDDEDLYGADVFGSRNFAVNFGLKVGGLFGKYGITDTTKRR